MVRQGRVSQGCRECRRLKRKCDEKQPTCGRCRARGLQCSGPPDFFQSRLRDETLKYINKQSNSAVTLTSHKSKSLSFMDTTSEEQNTPGFTLSTHGTRNSDFKRVILASGNSQRLAFLNYPPKVTAEFRAESFLFRALEAVSYVVPYPGWGPFVRCLPKLYASSSNNSPLQIATRALTLSTMSLSPGFSDYASLASGYYGAALRTTNAAIADPIICRSNETLMTTLLLSVYECYRPSVGTKTRSLYRSHLNGAISLLRNRGSEQFGDAVSKEMFRALRIQMVNLYAHRKEHIPSFPGPKGWRSDPDDDQDALSLLTAAALELPGLRADANHLADLVDRLEILRTTKELILRSAQVETALLTWHESFCDSWGLGLTRGQEVNQASVSYHPQMRHEYSNLSVASTANTYRAYRIYLHQVRIECFEALEQIQPPRIDLMPDYGLSGSTASAFILQQMCNEICASVPYHMDNENVTLGVSEVLISSPLISVSFVDKLLPEQKAYIEHLLYQIAFSERERAGPSLIWDARIMTRMGKFTKIPSALKSNL